MKTAVLQATVSKGTSCFSEQSLPSGEKAKRPQTLSPFPFFRETTRKRPGATGTRPHPPVSSASPPPGPASERGAPRWGDRDQAPDKRPESRRPRSHGSPTRPPRPPDDPSPSPRRRPRAPSRRKVRGGGVRRPAPPPVRVRASPHGGQPYRAPLGFTTVRHTDRGAGTPSWLWIGRREGASPLIGRERASRI